jgi:RNA polymerase sigma factor (sigma-70 family)
VTRIVGRHRRATDEGLTDAELLAAVRTGGTDTFGVLYDRHVHAARRLARVMVRDPADAEDPVAEAFTKVLAALRLGKGPTVAFRAYLLTAVRNACYDRARRDRRIELTEDVSRYERQQPAGDPALARLERSYAARAFAKLPERWQMVLWHTEVEGEKPAAIAPLLGLSPNAVAALAYRARERLRQMYLQEHLGGTGNPSCSWTLTRLGAHVRHALPPRDQSKVDAHLAGCARCRALWAELAEVNSGLRGVLAPVVLGVTASPYLAAAPGTSRWAATGKAVRHAWLAVGGRVRGQLRRYGSTNLAGGAGLAAAALVGVLLFALAVALGPDPDPVEPPPPPVAGEQDRPVPVPVPALSSVPSPAPAPARSPAPSPAPAPVPAPSPTISPDPAGPQPQPDVPAALPPPDPGATGPPAGPLAVSPDLSTTSLAAGNQGELAIAVHLPESAPVESPVVPLAGPGDPPDGVELAVGWPAGMALAGPDAGEAWRCLARESGAVCRRAGWAAGSSSTARLPVTVDETLGGFAPVTVTVTVDGRRGEAGFRVPVAPVGLEVGYAATGGYGVAMAGNTWLSCPVRPACLRGDRIDNDLVPLVPYLPGVGEPDLPPGLADPVAASGAELAIPAGAEVEWAALHWAATATVGPELVELHGPAGGWHRVTPDAVRPAGERPLRQAYADVTHLVSEGGAWWVAAGGPLPASGSRATAGWSLSVVYAERAAPQTEVAVFTGPVGLSASRQLSATAAATGEEVEVGLVMWEGDRTITGDALWLDGEPLGDPVNTASSRAAGALECGDAASGGCGWHTFGVDVAQYRATPRQAGDVTLHTPVDQLEVGVLSLAVEMPR